MKREGTLRLSRGTRVVAVGIDVQADGLHVGTLVGDGTGVALPPVEEVTLPPMGTPIKFHVDQPVVLTRTQVEQLKRHAKAIRKAEGIPHHEALLRVARASGYPSWTVLMRETAASWPAACQVPGGSTDPSRPPDGSSRQVKPCG